MSKFLIELIKPSRYDDDGYVVQWWRAWIPSNTLACMYAIAREADENKVLGEGTELEINAYDEYHTVIPVKDIARRFKANGNRGLVCLVGVQSNQFPRAMDLTRQLRAHGIQVAIGGFHVSGLMALIPEMPDDLREALDLGATLFAGEAEGRFGDLLKAADEGRMDPVYNYMDDLPDLTGAPTPYLPVEEIRKYFGTVGTFDAGRGCPFTCSFCTIINVQGRKSRFRTADDIERLVREQAAQGVRRFFITDDNFARNKNWEAIFDRLIELREEGLNTNFLIQMDTLVHRIPNFIEKAVKAGLVKAFVGLENINPDSLKSASKGQNKITEYRKMFQAWREQGMVTYAGYILGFPGDTPETIKRDMEIIKRELPVDILEFNILTPLPGSKDHQGMYERGEWMDPDMSKYDLEHVTQEHPLMSKEEWQKAYDDVWDQYYSWDHIETLLRRAIGNGIKGARLRSMIFQFAGCTKFEGVHPVQGGFFRRKVRTQRRSGMPRENPLIFYPRHYGGAVVKYFRMGLFYLRIRRIEKAILAEPNCREYRDLAITPVTDDDASEHLGLYEATDAAIAQVKKEVGLKETIRRAKEKSALAPGHIPLEVNN
jgi:radical SAM superfamily enzyme YgiQ (UPF0313 family)